MTDSSARRTLGSLFALVKPYRAVLAAGLVALAVGSALNLLIPELVRRMFQDVSEEGLYERSLQVGGALLAIFVAQGVIFFFRSVIFGRLGQHVVHDLRMRLFDSLLRRSIVFHEQHQSAELLSRLSADAALVQDAVSVKISVFLRYAIQVAGGLAMMLYISVKLTLMSLLVLPILVGTSISLARRLRSLSRRLQSEIAASTGFAGESISHLRTLRSFGAEGFASARFAGLAGVALDTGRKRATFAAFFTSFSSFLLNAALVIVLVFGASLLARDELNTASLTAFVMYGALVGVSFAFLANALADVAQVLGGVSRVFELLEEAQTDRTMEDRSTPSAMVAGAPAIRMKNVGFVYASRPDHTVLDDFSIEIVEGSSVAIVGQSGSGKSTIVSLLLRFYEPTSGSIHLFGAPIEGMSGSELRSIISVVPQEPPLFAASLRDNILLGDDSISPDRLERVCTALRLEQFVRTLPQGLDTPVGERGSQLSAGQRQRVAIARALLRTPRILLLDEATSALDSDTERAVFDALRSILPNATIISVAHRLATVQDADRIVVLDEGGIVQDGTHARLRAEPGRYRELVERQHLRS